MILYNQLYHNNKRAGQLFPLNPIHVQVSEENDDPIIIEEAYRGEYCVVMDRLDGSSNIDCGVSIGTIFGIYRLQPGSSGTAEDVLRVGVLNLNLLSHAYINLPVSKFGMYEDEAYPSTPISHLLAAETYELLLNFCL